MKRSRQTKREKRCARRDGYVLLPIDCVSHGRRVYGRTALKVPQNLAGGRVERHEIPLGVSGENQTTCGRKYAGP